MTSDRARLFNLTRESTLSAGVARGLIHAAERAGVPRVELLRAAGIAPEQLERPDGRVPRSEIYRLCELAMTLSNDPALGLHWGATHDGYTFDIVAQLLAHSPTLGAGLESLSKFQRLLTDQPSYHIIESADHVVIRCMGAPGESLRVQRFLSEMTVTGFWRLICAFSVDGRPERVSFQYPAPPYRAEYTPIFEGTERFDQPFTGIVFDSALMNAVSPHHDDDMQAVLRSVAERRLLRVKERTPYALRVREHLVKQGPRRGADMDTVARSLGLSARSLRRRLAVEGQTYERVADEAQAIMAKHLLTTTQLTLQETASTLGFSHMSTFHRAFKRWTGTTPLSYRAEQWRELQRSE